MRRALALALAISSALPFGCSRELLEQDPFVEPDLSGSVRVPLSTSTEDGTQYVLHGATVEISGTAMLTLHSQNEQLDGALTSPLPAGSYTAFLRPGFQMIEIAPDGTRREVKVALAGDNPRSFSLREVEDATVRLRFTHGARELVFGGAAPVRITRR